MTERSRLTAEQLADIRVRYGYNNYHVFDALKQAEHDARVLDAFEAWLREKSDEPANQWAIAAFRMALAELTTRRAQQETK